MSVFSTEKKWIQMLGFFPKENTNNIFIKKYTINDNYTIKIDFKNEQFDFGDLIKAESKTTQNFSQPENWVVLECVDRLLEKGYAPKNITLEKTWKTGHGTSGRLDVLVTHDDGSAYMMIECKTWGKEFDKEYKNLEKDGGQLFTYFQQDKNADILMLYASQLQSSEVEYVHKIIKIEEELRQTANVKDFYERWNKLPKINGVFDDWVQPYDFESKALTIDELKTITSDDSSFIFNQFLEILRHNVVSDKGNAFNRIFTLFLCKIYDEKVNEGTNNELAFQWLEGKDDHRSFQLRLTDLYKNGMHEFLEKVVTDFSETEFKNKFPNLSDDLRDPIIEEFRKVRLEKNNEFAIKDVYDEQSFQDNAVVVKEIVELLQSYKLRYTKKQQYLSDFFELLLTTGLKQESGQFFTPVPIAQYVIKSLPIDKLVEEKLTNATIANKELLPYVMDYASGSGHFLTEMMDIIQKELNKKDRKNYSKSVGDEIEIWKLKHFSWAIDYVYGIEKDYRLVKVGKVGCYLHGDGLANVIHTDGLARFGHPDYKGKLLETDSTYPQENKQFDVIVSNPPYSVSAFKNVARKYYTEDDYNIYDSFTDQSSEIECLFIERTKQLLKDGGVAGIILPSSILSNGGIYAKSREMLLQYFDILGITEFGSNTFMATGTNTVVLFLRRRSNYIIDSLKTSVADVFVRMQDVTLNGVEHALSNYVAHVWEDLTTDDYKTLLNKAPNDAVQAHDIYQEYQNKIKIKSKGKEKAQAEFFAQVLATEQEKLLYFVIAYAQKVVLVKTGDKKAEKQFLGYEFSNRRGSEGIHPIQRSKEIHECTKLFDEYSFTNTDKASTYNYLAFADNKFDADIPDDLKQNISYQNLVDMLTFDRVDFDKNISLNAKKKLKIESKWEQRKLGSLTTLLKRGKSAKYGKSNIQIIKSGQARGIYEFDFTEKHYVAENFILDERKLQHGDLLLNSSGVGTAGRVTAFFLDGDFVADSHISILRLKQNEVLPKYLLNLFCMIGFKTLESLALGQSGQIEMTLDTIENIKVPLPPLDIQQTVVDEIEILDIEEATLKAKLLEKEAYIITIVDNISSTKLSLENVTSKIGSGATPKGGEGSYHSSGITLIRSQNVHDNNFIEKGLVFINEEQASKLDNVTVESNDILFNITGASIARCCMVQDKYLPARVNQHVAIIRVESQKALAKYVQMILISPNIKKELLAIGDGATSRQALTKGQLEQFKIPLPTLAEQQNIVVQIEKIEAEIAELERKIADIPQQKEAVLKKYL